MVDRGSANNPPPPNSHLQLCLPPTPGFLPLEQGAWPRSPGYHGNRATAISMDGVASRGGQPAPGVVGCV